MLGPSIPRRLAILGVAVLPSLMLARASLFERTHFITLKQGGGALTLTHKTIFTLPPWEGRVKMPAGFRVSIINAQRPGPKAWKAHQASCQEWGSPVFDLRDEAGKIVGSICTKAGLP